MDNQYYNYTRKINHDVVREIISIINSLINYKDFENAREELKTLKRHIGNNSYYLNIYTYLNNKINEEETLTSEILEDIEYGNFYLGRKDNYQVLGDALFYFENGLKKTKHNIFNYYIGRTYYALKNYDAAFEYFRKYSLNGGIKACKNYIYMAVLLSKKLEEKDFNYAELCVTLAERIGRYDTEGRTVDDDMKYYIHKMNMEEEKVI